MALGQIATIIGLIGVAFLCDEFLQKTAKRNSVLHTREPLDLERLYEAHFQVDDASKHDMMAALQFVEKCLGDEANRLRPDDRFSVELAHLCSGMDSDVELMWLDLATEFRLSQGELDSLVGTVDTVQGFLNVYVSLATKTGASV